MLIIYLVRPHSPGTPEISQAPPSPLTDYPRTPSPTLGSPAPAELSPSLSQFYSFLKAAFDIADEGSIIHTKTQEKISKNRDFYLPFRQLAPSKQIILDNPQGPFSPTKLQTREGFFDALIFRLITQASPILLQERHVCFGSPSGFYQITSGKAQRYYCNPIATGQHNRLSNIPHIAEYWEHAVDWNNLLKRPEVTLQSLMEWLVGNRGNRKRFFGMGNLVGWLLASDYAFAGLVSMPEVSEVGKIIFRINAGSKGGLGLLGFDVGSPEACAESLSNLWDSIQTHFKPAEIQAMGLNSVVLEHALCKFQRLHKVIKLVCDKCGFLFKQGSDVLCSF